MKCLRRTDVSAPRDPKVTYRNNVLSKGRTATVPAKFHFAITYRTGRNLSGGAGAPGGYVP
jgi:hypothetical protein